MLQIILDLTNFSNKLLEDKTLLEKKVSHALERHPELAEDLEV